MYPKVNCLKETERNDKRFGEMYKKIKKFSDEVFEHLNMYNDR